MENRKQRHYTSKKLARLALLSALGSIAVIMEFPIFPMTPFLKYDIGDVPIFISAIAYGPLEGFLLTIVVSYVQSFVIHGSGGIYGFIMHIIATGTMTIVLGSLNKYLHKKLPLWISMLFGVIAMTVVMIPANLIITPLFSGLPTEEVALLLPYIIMFNIIKSGVNSAFTYFLYNKVLKDRLLE